MVWVVLAIIFAVLFLIFNLYVKIRILYNGDSLKLTIGILFIKYTLIPVPDENPKKPKKKKKEVKAEPEKSKQKKEKAELKFDDVTDLISVIKTIVSKVLFYFDKYLRVDIRKLRIKVAADDAATAAILYGLTSQGVSYLMAILRENVKKIKVKHNDSILVTTDFTSENFDARIDVIFRLRVWQLIVLGVGTLKKFILNSHNIKI